MSSASSPEPNPVPSPAIPPAAEPTGFQSEHEASLSLVAQLRDRIEAADTHLMRVLDLAQIGQACCFHMKPSGQALEPAGRVLDLIKERIELAREGLITAAERDRKARDGEG